ncbi:MAG: DUF2628 domain-containing protein [Culicoidibacterales bacterium]
MNQQPQFDEKGRPYAKVEPRTPYGSVEPQIQPEPEAPVQQATSEQPPPQQPQGKSTRSGVLESEYANYIQKNQNYYLPKFCLRGGKVSWNWAAFFLGPLWLVYRKMYAQAALWFLILMITSIFGAFILALCANRLYYLKATQFIAMQKISQLSPEEQRIKIIRAGGTLF